MNEVGRSQVNTTIYLLIVGSNNVNNQDGRQYQTTTRRSITIGSAKTIYPKSKDCKLIAK